MNLKIVKSLLLLALFCSAIFAVTIISVDLYAVQAVTDKCTNNIHYENTATLTYISGPVDGEYTPCGGDEVPGGGVPQGNRTG